MVKTSLLVFFGISFFTYSGEIQEPFPVPVRARPSLSDESRWVLAIGAGEFKRIYVLGKNSQSGLRNKLLLKRGPHAHRVTIVLEAGEFISFGAARFRNNELICFAALPSGQEIKIQFDEVDILNINVWDIFHKKNDGSGQYERSPYAPSCYLSVIV